MPDRPIREQIIASAERIVVKVGTSGICDETGRLSRRAVSGLARQVAAAKQRGVSVTLVVSGAIGSGMGELGLDRRPRTMPQLQAAAAVGQGRLMQTFHHVFARHGLKVAQVLVTRDGFEDRTRYLNIRNTLRALAEYDALPVINENDTVSVDEIRFGDNDVLAALVANMLAADLLVLLSNVDGLMQGRRMLDVVEQVDDDARALVDPSRSRFGSGGMASKLAAAGLVTRAGDVAVIANARAPRVLERLLAGERVGTVFVPAGRKLSSRRRWIAHASRAVGRIVIDDGAVRALTERGTSLLASGITAVTGTFAKGATVAILDPSGREIARGLTNYSADQIRRIAGLKSSEIARALGDKPYDEVVHRNNMTMA